MGGKDRKEEISGFSSDPRKRYLFRKRSGSIGERVETTQLLIQVCPFCCCGVWGKRGGKNLFLSKATPVLGRPYFSGKGFVHSGVDSRRLSSFSKVKQPARECMEFEQHRC